MKNYFKVDNKFDLKQNLQHNENNDKSRDNKKFLTSAASLNIGIYLITPILLGVFIGYNLDSYLNKRPLFTIIFIIFGSISSFYNLIKLTKN